MNTCDEDRKEVTGGPLHAIELELTSEMNCAQYQQKLAIAEGAGRSVVTESSLGI